MKDIGLNEFRNNIYQYIAANKDEDANFLSGLETAVVIAEKMAASPCEVCPLVKEMNENVNELVGELYDEEGNLKPRYCDRNICTKNEYNGISCDECEVAKYHNLEDDDSICMDCEVGE